MKNPNIFIMQEGCGIEEKAEEEQEMGAQ